jgi:hypothetical protein
MDPVEALSQSAEQTEEKGNPKSPSDAASTAEWCLAYLYNFTEAQTDPTMRERAAAWAYRFLKQYAEERERQAQCKDECPQLKSWP